MTRCKSRSLVFAFACASLSLPGFAQDLPAPVFPGAAWETRTPADLGMNQLKLDEAKAYALTRNGAGMIVRNGYVVSSWGKTTDRFPVASVTKSIGTLVLGYAVKDQGVSLDAKAQDYYLDFGTNPVENIATTWLDDITIEELATHSAGFEKPGGAPRLKWQPATTWVYSDGAANWLADVLTVRLNEDLAAVLKREFLDHMNIALVSGGAGGLEWRAVTDTDPRGATINGIQRRQFNGGISAHVDAMARIGLLLERNGTWNGMQLLQPEFVAKLANPAPGIAGLPIFNTGGAPDDNFPNATAHLGLYWWNNADGTLPNVPRDAFWAWGRGDHLIVVIPSMHLVAARTSSRANEGPDRLQPWAWKDTLCQDTMCAHYDALDPFLTPIVQSITGGPAPAVTFSSSASTVAAGGTVTLTWSAANATGCAASGGWSGNKAASGTESVTVSQTSTYTLACTGTGGTVSQSVNVTAEASGGDDGGGGGGVLQWWMVAALCALYGARRRVRLQG
jgi:CubicO group peptidase (beta-lactamase class C family)